jgi:hypothetical protein
MPELQVVHCCVATTTPQLEPLEKLGAYLLLPDSWTDKLPDS